MSIYDDIEQNATSLDKFVNDNNPDVPTRRGGTKPSYQYLVDSWNAEFAATLLEINKSRGFRVVGLFADGFEYELFNDVGIDANGDSWIYIGSGAPANTVTAGTDPSTLPALYQQVTYNNLQDITNLDKPSGLDDVNIRDMNIADIIAEDAALGTRYRATDLGGARYDVTSNADIGGYYYATMSSGRKLILIIENGELSANNLGMVEGAGQDNSDKLNALNLLEFSKLTINGSYEYTSNVNIVKPNKTFAIVGSGELIGVGASLTIAGAITEVGTCNSLSGKGQNNLSVTNADAILASDDVFIMHNQTPFSFSQHRSDYHDGEFNSVLSVSGNVITVKNPLETSYSSVLTNVCYRLDGVTVSIGGGVSFKSVGGVYPLRVFYGVNCYVDSVTNGGTSASLQFNKCYNTVLIGSEHIMTNTISGDEYGVVAVNCQYFDMYGGYAYGTRHGVSTGSDGFGGAVPNRYVNFHDVKIGGGGSVYAADFHGNTANSYFINCTSYASVGLAGKDVGWLGGKIFAGTNNAPCGYHEVVGGSIRFEPGEIEWTDNGTSPFVLSNLSGTLVDNIDEDYKIIFKNAKLKLTPTITSLVNYYESSGNNNEIIVTDITLYGDTPGLSNAINIAIAASGLRPSRISLTDLYGDLSNLTKFVNVSSGSLSGSVATMPTVTKKSSVTINVGDWYSQSGGSGDTGVFNFNYPDYPSTPNICVSHEGFARVSSPRFFGCLDNSSKSSANAFISTASSSDAVVVDRDFTLTVTSSMHNLVL